MDGGRWKKKGKGKQGSDVSYLCTHTMQFNVMSIEVKCKYWNSYVGKGFPVEM